MEDEENQERPDSVKISRTAKGTATWEIKVRSKDLTIPEEQERVRKVLEKVWNDLKARFPT